MKPILLILLSIGCFDAVSVHAAGPDFIIIDERASLDALRDQIVFEYKVTAKASVEAALLLAKESEIQESVPEILEAVLTCVPGSCFACHEARSDRRSLDLREISLSLIYPSADSAISESTDVTIPNRLLNLNRLDTDHLKRSSSIDSAAPDTGSGLTGQVPAFHSGNCRNV